MKLFIITIILTICFAQAAFAQCKIGNCGLTVRGKVTNLEQDRSRKGYLTFKVQLAMEFKNEGDQPIILFKPNTDHSYFEDRYYLGGKSLFLMENEEPLFVHSAWESIMGTPFYRSLANKLDTKIPDSEYTKILQPNEVWSFADKTEIAFGEKEKSYRPTDKSWGEMQKLPSKLRLVVSFELNPWNVEFFKPKLIRKLKKRWANYGNVLIRSDEGEFTHFTISSEPMLIDFSEAKEIQEKR